MDKMEKAMRVCALDGVSEKVMRRAMETLKEVKRVVRGESNESAKKKAMRNMVDLDIDDDALDSTSRLKAFALAKPREMENLLDQVGEFLGVKLSSLSERCLRTARMPMYVRLLVTI